MKRPIAISLSPNTEPDDIKKAWQVLFSPSSWHNESHVTTVSRKLSSLLNNQSVAMTSSGRQALYHLLKALNIGEGDEVIIQPFTCIAVPAPVQWAGATPIYADIDPQTYNYDVAKVAEKISPRTRAIIIQHTFGIPGPIEEIKQLTAGKNIKVIEDCAHAFGNTYKNQPLGTCADAAIISFGRDKTFSSVFGGAVTSSDAELIQRIQKSQNKLPYPPTAWVIQQLLHPILVNSILPFYFFYSVGKVALIAAQRLHILGKAVLPAEKRGKKVGFIEWRYSPALAQLLHLQLSKFNRFVERRSDIVKTYSEALPQIARPAQPLLRFPIQVKNPEVVRKQAQKQHMLVGTWYDQTIVPCHEPFSVCGYTGGSCPNAEALSASSLNLPTYPLMTDAQVKKVVDFVRPYIV